MSSFVQLRDSLWALLDRGETEGLRRRLDGVDRLSLSQRDGIEFALLEAGLALLVDSPELREFWSTKALADALDLGDHGLIGRARETMAMACRRLGQLDRACAELDAAAKLRVPERARTRRAVMHARYLSLGGKVGRATSILDDLEASTGRSLSIQLRRLTNALFLGDPQAILSSIRRIQRLPAPAEEQIKFACLLAHGVANLQLGRCELAAKNFRKAR